MSTHMRLKGSEGELYTPGRDLAYCFHDMVENVANRFSENKWPALMALMEREKIEFPQLQAGMDSFCRFLVEAQQKPDRDIRESMRSSGWLDQPPQVQIAINAMLGSVVMGQLFAAVRDLALIDAPHQRNMLPLIKYGKISKLLMYMPPWRRRLFYLTRDTARKLRRLFAKKESL